MTNKWDFPKVEGFKFYNGRPEKYGFRSVTRIDVGNYVEVFTWTWDEVTAREHGIVEIPESMRQHVVTLDLRKTNFNCGMANMSLGQLKPRGLSLEQKQLYWAVIRECIAKELSTKNLTWLAMSFALAANERKTLGLKSLREDPCYGFFNRVFISSSRYDSMKRRAPWRTAIHYYVVRRYSLALEMPRFPSLDLKNMLTVDEEEFPKFTALERAVALKILSGNYNADHNLMKLSDSLQGVEIGAAKRIREKLSKLIVEPETVTDEHLFMGEGRNWG